MNRVACVAFLFGSVLGCQPKSSDAVEPGSSANFKRGEFPALGKGKVVAPGVVLHEVNVGPPGVKRRLWVYMPEKPPAGKLPCVLIGGAGTRLFHGMALGDGDRPEHLPWVKAGFAVVAFDIDGDLQGDNPTNAQAFAAAKLFRDARAGRGNVKLAFDYVVEKIPDIDPKNASIVGHSSAATLALIAAADEKRLRACVAFAPATDVVTYLADGAEEFERPIPGFTRFIRDSSPLTQVGKISCPVFVFSAADDTNTTRAEVAKFVAELEKTNKRVTFEKVERGGHYDSMIASGIPKAIKWVKGLPAK